MKFQDGGKIQRGWEGPSPKAVGWGGAGAPPPSDENSDNSNEKLKKFRKIKHISVILG